jgi:hypothetical protein
VIVITQYLLALYRDYAVPDSPEQTQHVRAGVNVLGDKLTDAGAFVSKSGPLPVESATVVRQFPGGPVN